MITQQVSDYSQPQVWEQDYAHNALLLFQDVTFFVDYRNSPTHTHLNVHDEIHSKKHIFTSFSELDFHPYSR